MQEPGITQWQLPLLVPGTVAPLIHNNVPAETTIVPGQQLMRVMPRSWQFKPMYGFSLSHLFKSGVPLLGLSLAHYDNLLPLIFLMYR